MRTQAIWVATFALMLGVTSAHAQESKPTDIPSAATPATSVEVVIATIPAPTEAKEPADVPLATEATTTGSCGEKPCYLWSAHYKALQEQIAAKQAEIDKLGEQFVAANAASAEDRRATQEHRAVATLQRDAIKVALGEAVEQLRQLNLQFATAAQRAAELRLDPPWAGWHWGLNLQGQYQLGTGQSAVYAPLQLGVFGRWVSKVHLGVEAGAAGGVWFTEKWAPPMVSGHFAGVASWEHWGVFIGHQLSVLHSTYNKGGMFTQVAVQAGGEFKAGGFNLRAWLAPAVFSPIARTSGLGLGLSLGYYCQ